MGWALLGGSAVPAGGLDVILWHAQAVAVQESEVVLRGGFAGVGAGVQVGKFLC